MTNMQKKNAKMLARDTDMSSKELARFIGCTKATAAKYIRVFRKQQKGKTS